MSKELDDTINQLNAIAANLRTNIQTLDETINQKRARLGDLLDMPLSKADYMAYIEADIDRLGERYSKGINGIVARTGKATVGLAEMEGLVAMQAADKTFLSNELLPYLTAGVIGTAVTREAMYWLFGAQIKARLADSFDQIEWVEDAIPVAERKAEIEALHTEIITLETQRDALAAKLLNAGLQG